MNNRDLHNTLVYAIADPPVSVADNTAFITSIFDMQDYDALEFLMVIGSLADADATFVVLVEHGDDSGLSDAAAVPDDQLLGTEAEAAPLFTDDNSVKKIGYVGDKRYVRLTLTPAANSGVALLGIATIARSRNRGV